MKQQDGVAGAGSLVDVAELEPGHVRPVRFERKDTGDIARQVGNHPGLCLPMRHRRLSDHTRPGPVARRQGCIQFLDSTQVRSGRSEPRAGLDTIERKVARSFRSVVGGPRSPSAGFCASPAVEMSGSADPPTRRCRLSSLLLSVWSIFRAFLPETLPPWLFPGSRFLAHCYFPEGSEMLPETLPEGSRKRFRKACQARRRLTRYRASLWRALQTHTPRPRPPSSSA